MGGNDGGPVLKSAKLRLHLLASRTHKWLAIIIGAQLLLWFTSGALMSFLPIDRVHGDHLINRKATAALPSGVPLAPASAIVATTAAPIEAVTYRMWLGRPVAEVTTAKGTRLFDARTGAALPTPTAATAEAVAREAWRGSGRPAATVERIERPSPEYRGTLPAWRVTFADPDSTRVFVAADTGRIAAVRTGTWRLYDFFWGLHIMDWQNHENFNTPWLLAFAIGGLALWLGGAVLLYIRWPKRRRRSAAERGTFQQESA
ncbi:PepSY domain-containing protein [Sphingomonas sp.]|uniref:PepSY domain-containing protein n=1 Tax=Sphingomonas sp. TaxID=28214 RepID=UPI00258F27D7|nr:PepSY domain-containing protein [Sphingomonas sp.]